MKTDTKVMVAGVLVLGLGAWYLTRQVSGAVRGVGQGITDAWGAVNPGSVRDVVGSIGGYANAGFVGAVEGAGLAVGIPRTSMSKCQADKAAGNWWEASFSCPAADFLGGAVSGVFGSTAVRQAEQADVRRLDNLYDYTDPSNPFSNQAGYDFRHF